MNMPAPSMMPRMVKACFDEFNFSKILLQTGKISDQHARELKSLLEEWNGRAFVAMSNPEDITEPHYSTKKMEFDASRPGSSHDPDLDSVSTSRKNMEEVLLNLRQMKRKERRERQAERKAGKAEKMAQNKSRPRGGKIRNQSEINKSTIGQPVKTRCQLKRERKAQMNAVMKGQGNSRIAPEEDDGPAASVIKRRLVKEINKMEFDFNNLSMKTQ